MSLLDYSNINSDFKVIRTGKNSSLGLEIQLNIERTENAKNTHKLEQMTLSEISLPECWLPKICQSILFLELRA